MASARDNIDRELTKLSAALHAAILDEAHDRYCVLMADIDDLLDRRLATAATG